MEDLNVKVATPHKCAIEIMAVILIILSVIGGLLSGFMLPVVDISGKTVFNSYMCVAIIASGLLFGVLLLALANIAGAIEESNSKVYCVKDVTEHKVYSVTEVNEDTVSPEVKGQKGYWHNKV